MRKIASIIIFTLITSLGCLGQIQFADSCAHSHICCQIKCKCCTHGEFPLLLEPKAIMSIDTSCIRATYLGTENAQQVNLEWINNSDEQLPSYFSIDTISKTAFNNYKNIYTSPLKSDSGRVVWTDTSFIIKGKQYKSDNSYFNYYLGFLENLQLYSIIFVDGRDEVSTLIMIDAVTGENFWLESPSSYSLESPSISTDLSILSAYVHDSYSNYSFISFFDIKKHENKYCLEDRKGLKISNVRIDELLWINNLTFVILVTEVSDYEIGKQYVLKIKVSNH